MYLPKAFEVSDVAEVHRLMAGIGAAHLVTSGAEGLDATLLPWLVEAEPAPLGTLVGHVARANPQWRVAAEGPVPALAVFSGPQAYVSPTWYPTKQATGEVAPTWNYVVVHAHGELIVHDDPAWTERLVRRLTDHHEASVDEPWSVDDAPAPFVEKMVRAIVGIELRIIRLQAKRKLSQNRPLEDRAGVVAALGTRDPGSRLVAEAMRSEGD